MKMRKVLTMALAVTMAAGFTLTGCGGSGNSSDGGDAYKVAIVKYVDDASLNQIQSNI